MRAQSEAERVVFRFAEIEVRESEFLITLAGARLPVEPKAFKVLLYLLHNSGRIVTKNELLDAVWGDAAVTENSLTRVIALLRHLLGDDPHEQRFIETVATVGYRFVYPVEVVADPQVNEGSEIRNGLSVLSPDQTIANPKGNQIWIHRHGLPLTALALAVVTATSAWYVLHPPSLLRITKFTQLTHDGRAKNLRGTDGARLFFNTDFKLQRPIGQISISGGDIVPIPIQLPGPELFDISPDGSSLLVTSTEGGRTTLWSVGASGSPIRHLADGAITSAAWSPDGKLVAYTTIKSIEVMRSDGTEVHTVFSNSSQVETPVLWGPRWSPDGRAIRFMKDHRYWEMSSDGSNPHPMHPTWRPSFWECCGSWTSDGSYFIFRVNEAPWRSSRAAIPGAELWALDEGRGLLRRHSAEPFQLASGPIRWGFPVPGKDSTRIFARGNTLHGELVRYDATSRNLEPYLGGISAEFVAFSPDGKSLVYGSYPEGILWRAKRDGSNPVQLTSPPWYPMIPRWSPDGTQLIFTRTNEEGRTESYIMPSRGGTPQPLFPNDQLPQGDPTWSPDGKKIVISTDNFEDSIPKGGIRIFDLATRQMTMLPGSKGRWSPRWSPNGRFIAGLDSPDWNLVIFDFKTKQWSTLQKGRLAYPTWSHDGKFLYYMQAFDEDPGVYRIRPSGGKAERIVDLRGVRLNSMTVVWMGLDPEDAPLGKLCVGR
jgi:DNA-binding winged helix-turn-helix (wHTH) protein/Tol biopolymer transport system component